MKIIAHHIFPSSQRGTTLLELLVTISIAAILMGVAVPSFQGMMRTNRIASVTNEMGRALMLTRSEAVSRGTNVSLCNTANPNSTTPSCSGGTWATGWLIKVNSNDEILRIGTLSSTNAIITNTEDEITYTPLGNVTDESDFKVEIDTEKRIIQIKNTGRTRTCNPNKAGVVDCTW
ncbi:GspH/FimT family pseudopilin [Thiorhodovibrio winogradskyi]|uniref:GspH/FimT family pseudopilin n=1 Tax=Thiorhodovibrio winogradskyi TaxID=77007 RepID=UPI002E2BD7C0|nr:GspH/FimT family pseudopilin [Thiorhodovibrio winogradskyi]